jgi:hypothetical protein
VRGGLQNVGKLDGATANPAQQWSPWKLLTQVENWVKEGIKVYRCYEAGPVGIGIIGN